jgi:GGDEF domain-containing protein
VDGVIVDEQITDRRLGVSDPKLAALLDTARDVAGLPVGLLTHEPVDASRLAIIHELGVWGTIPFPLGASAWAGQFGVWVEAARRLRRRVDAGLVDAATGLYNADGLLRRAVEIDGDVRRRGGAVACAIFDFPEDAASAGQRVAVDVVAQVCRTAGRAADTFGRIGERDFAVVAPDADVEGVHLLVRRIADSVERAHGAAPGLRVGACGAIDLNEGTLTIPDMLSYAASRRAPLRSEQT